MGGVTLRLARARDAGEVAEVHMRAWKAAYRGLLPGALVDALSVEQRERGWQWLLARSTRSSWTLVAEDERGRIVGFCAIVAPARDRDAARDVAELAAIYVEPTRWRQGVGTALVEAALDALRASGWRELTLWVLAGNAPALAFYRRFGFRADGEESPYEHLERAQMRLRLSLL